MKTFDFSDTMFGLDVRVTTNGKFADFVVTDPETGGTLVSALRADFGGDWTINAYERRLRFIVGEAIVRRNRRNAPKCATCGDPLDGGECHYCER